MTRSTRNLVTRDGHELFTTIHQPADYETAPCLLVRLPLPEGIRYGLFREGFGRIWARRGYTTVIQYVRGYPPSTGAFVPFVYERQDGEELINWLRESKTCQQQIHTWGGSYFGLTQWAIGDLFVGSKAIQISSPRLPMVFFNGGAFSLSTALFWSARFKGDRQPSREAIWQAALGTDPVTAERRLLGDNSTWFREWYESGHLQQYWTARHLDPNLPLKGPVLLMAGWYDPFLTAMLKDYAELKSRGEVVRLIIGPWAHAATASGADGYSAGPYRSESLNRPLAWLANQQESKSHSGVEIFLPGSNRWLELDDYPPRGSQNQVWSLHLADGVMKLEGRGQATEHHGAEPNSTRSNRATTDNSEHTLILDPMSPVPSMGGVDLGFDFGPMSQASIVNRTDVLPAFSDTLTEPMHILGIPRILGQTASEECSPDVVVTLVDVFPDGNPYLITEGIQRLRARQSSISIELWPTAYTILAGHRLGILIAPSSYPKYDLPRCILDQIVDRTSTKDFALKPLALRLLDGGVTKWSLHMPTSGNFRFEKNPTVLESAQ